MSSAAWTPVDESIRVQDEKGVVHVFPKEATPEMIAKALNVKPPTSGAPDYDALAKKVWSDQLDLCLDSRGRVTAWSGPI